MSDAIDRNVEAVRQRLLQRAHAGFAKYGVTTERGDLSAADWLLHLQEELLDAAVYVERLKRELAIAEARGWRSMESAPNGRELLLLWGSELVSSGRKRYGQLGEPSQDTLAWRASCCGRYATPIGWQPLPPPTAARREGGAP